MHHRNCTEHLQGYPERRRFGTAEQHREWLEEIRLFSRGGEDTHE